MIKRKKKIIDGMDREILRVLNKRHPITMSGSSIARGVDIASSAIAPRLNNLQMKGIIKQKEIQGLRKFERRIKGHQKFVKIKAPRSILWGIDFKKKKK